MVINTMQVFYGADCLPYKDKERTVHYPIIEPAFQGSSQVNEIKFYVDRMVQSDLAVQWIAVAKLPNGKTGLKVLERYDDDNGVYVLFQLSDWFTQAKGDLYISLRGYAGGTEITYDEETELYTITGDPVIQSTGAVKMTIRYATPISGEEETDITIQELISLIGSKVSKSDGKYFKIVDSISNINTSDYAQYIRAGDIVYAKDDKTIYSIYGTIPTLAATPIIDLTKVVLTTGNQTIYGSKTFVNGITANNDIDITSGKLEVGTTNKTTVKSTGVLTETSDNSIELGRGANAWALEIDETYSLSIPNESGIIATQSWTQGQIADALVSAYKLQGSASVSTLNGLTKTSTLNGNVYNVTDSGTLTNNDNTTISVSAGDNVVFIWNEGSWYWDDLVGIFDTSNFVDLTSAQTITGAKTFTSDIVLYAASGTSPSIKFLRGTESDSNYDWLVNDESGELVFSQIASGTTNKKYRMNANGFNPHTSLDLGTSSYKWKDLYLSGKAYIGTTGNSTFIDEENGSLRLSSNTGVIKLDGTSRPTTNGTRDLGESSYKWKDLYLAGNLSDSTNSYSIEESMAQFNPTTTGVTTIRWTKMLSFSLSADTTFTFETAKTDCLSEYKAIISNAGSSSITLTFPNTITSILCNDDNITISGYTMTLPIGVSIEISCVDGNMVAINFEA